MNTKKIFKDKDKSPKNVWCSECHEYPKMYGHDYCYKCFQKHYAEEKEHNERMISKGWY